MRSTDKPERLTFRLGRIDTQKAFYDFVASEQMTPSEAVRYCIKETLKYNTGNLNVAGLSKKEKDGLKADVFEIKRVISRIGGNLNVIARDLNMDSGVSPSDLSKELSDAQKAFSSLTGTLQDVLKVI